MDSLEKVEGKSAPIPMQNQQPNFLSEMKVVLGKQNRSESGERPEGTNVPHRSFIRPLDSKTKTSLNLKVLSRMLKASFYLFAREKVTRLF